MRDMYTSDREQGANWNRRSRSGAIIGWLAALAVALAACGELTPASGSEPDDALGQHQQESLAEALNTTPTAWWWYYGVTPAQLSSLVSANNARIVSLQVEQVSPLLFTVAMVSNTGSYGKAWWYYYGVTA